MIIIKTSSGDMYVNEGEFETLRHNRNVHTVELVKKGTISIPGKNEIVREVMAIVYLNKEQSAQWRDDGSEVEYLRKSIEEYKIEVACRNEIIKDLKSRLHKIGHKCVEFINLNLYENATSRVNLRNEGEDAKAYFLHDDDITFKRAYMHNHKVPEELEADEISRLNDQIEDMDRELRERDNRVDQLSKELERSNKWCEAYRKATERLMLRNLWHRIINKKTYIWPEE